MRKTKIICDLCKTEVEVNGYSYGVAEGFRKVELKMGDYNRREFELCPKCLQKNGLVKEDETPKRVSEPTTAEKLYEIIAEIVAENTDC